MEVNEGVVHHLVMLLLGFTVMILVLGSIIAGALFILFWAHVCSALFDFWSIIIERRLSSAEQNVTAATTLSPPNIISLSSQETNTTSALSPQPPPSECCQRQTHSTVLISPSFPTLQIPPPADPPPPPPPRLVSILKHKKTVSPPTRTSSKPIPIPIIPFVRTTTTIYEDENCGFEEIRV